MKTTHLSQEIVRTEGQCQYDENVKLLLSNKQVLARIMKYSVHEFSDYDIDTIIECIEGEPEVSKRGLRLGKKTAEKITAMNNESKIPDEGEITYDIRFYAMVPEDTPIKIILNVEAQKKYHVGYHFAARGIFYCSRMISEQLDTEFTTDDYDGIKKVYSIWICMNTPQKYANTISEYSIQEKSVFGNFRGVEKYDLLSVILIRLPKKKENVDQENILIRLLTILLSHELDADTKKQKLATEFEMKFVGEVEGGVSNMCNLSDLIVEETTERVTCEKLIEAVENVMESLELSLERACEVLKTTVQEYEEAKKILSSN